MYGMNFHTSSQVINAALGTKTSTVTSSAIDRLNFDEVSFKQTVGTVSGTSPTLDGKIQHCDTSGGSYTDVTGAVFTQVTASTKEQLVRILGVGLKRYVKYVGTIAGTSPSFDLSVECILCCPQNYPTSLVSGHTAHVSVQL
jgi:hypothetical protein